MKLQGEHVQFESLFVVCYCMLSASSHQTVMYMQALQGISSSCQVFQLLHCKRCFGSDWLCLLPHLIRLLAGSSIETSPFSLHFLSLPQRVQHHRLCHALCDRVCVMTIFLCRRPNSIPISCYQNLNLDGLLVKMWEMMALVCLQFL